MIHSVSLVFPHQLFRMHPALHRSRKVICIEELLFFRQYSFHKQKLAFHRSTLKFYSSWLTDQGFNVSYINSQEETSDIRKLIPSLEAQGVSEIHCAEVVDDWLNRRITGSAEQFDIKINWYHSPNFLNTPEEIKDWFGNKKEFFQTRFYIDQRKKRKILITANQAPVGDKWSFDPENRKKYPRNLKPPEVQFPEPNRYTEEAIDYVERHFPGNPGKFKEGWSYPVTFEEAEAWFEQFLKSRIHDFGTYEDAIVSEARVLHHSVLSPLLNVGLLTPGYVLEKTLDFSKEHQIPMNSLEGFTRQILGWREFIRAVYMLKGREERTRNFWGFDRKIPTSFWEGSTGIEPLDIVIVKVLETGYAHHIERLMVLGNFMLLCEFDPDEVYRWFMELFIDAYDWVMVPNVYGMSQFADGGLMSTKPYISGSNYLLKMSDFPKGDWHITWDALFWRFLHVHRDFFQKNPRMNMLVKTWDKWPEDKKQQYLAHAESFLKELDGRAS